MLVLTRRPGESLIVGDGIEIQVIRIEGDRVVIGIVAPPDVAVVRSELIRRAASSPAVPRTAGDGEPG
jgi:carbon storage regulator